MEVWGGGGAYKLGIVPSAKSTWCLLFDSWLKRRTPVTTVRVWCDGSSDRSLMVDPLSYLSFQLVLHNWCNEGRGMCYLVCGMVHIKYILLLIGKSSPSNGGSGFHLALDPLSYFSFQPVLHDWCSKDRGMCYPVCGMVHIKELLLLTGKSSLCGGSGFPFSLSEWSLTICLTPYNRK